MKKKIVYTFIILLSLLLLAFSFGIWKFNNALFKETPNYFRFKSEEIPIHFNWASQKIGGIKEMQAAMIIPLKIKDLTHQLYVQFDTGAPTSFIYEKALISLRKTGIEIKEIIKNNERYVAQLDFVLGGNQMKATMIKIYPNYGTLFDKNDTIKAVSIGTLGSDFLVDKITSIDFKNQKIHLFDEKPSYMSSLIGFKKFDFVGRRIMLPITINNKDDTFLYDSGCSAFGLITIKNRFDNYTNKSTIEVKYDAKSWENQIPIRSKKSEQLFTIGSKKLKLKRVSYVDMYTAIQPLVTPFTKIGGWLGNQPFTESTLILNTKNEEFIVIESK